MVVDFDILRFDAGLWVDYNALDFFRLFRGRLSPCILGVATCARSRAPWRGPQRSQSASREPPSHGPTIVVAYKVLTALLTSTPPFLPLSYIGSSASLTELVTLVRLVALYWPLCLNPAFSPYPSYNGSYTQVCRFFYKTRRSLPMISINTNCKY